MTTTMFSTTDLQTNDIGALLEHYAVFGARREADLNKAFVYLVAAHQFAAQGDVARATDALRRVMAFSIDHDEPRPMDMAFQVADAYGIAREAIDQPVGGAIGMDSPHVPFVPTYPA